MVDFDKELKTVGARLLSYVKSIVFEKSDAEDIVQNTLLILCEKRNEFDENKHFQGWAFQICKFQIKKYLTQKSRDKKKGFFSIKEDDITDEPFVKIADLESNNFNKKRLKSSLNHLPTRQKDLLGYILSGYSKAEILSFMKIKDINFNTIKFRAISSCKNILEKASEEKFK